jgi:phosphate transport system substrate-binding protein
MPGLARALGREIPAGEFFTDYLTKISPAWAAGPKFGNSVNWPGGVGASGNAGVAGAVKQTPGAIGYVELIYALQQKLGAGVILFFAANWSEIARHSNT